MEFANAIAQAQFKVATGIASASYNSSAASLSQAVGSPINKAMSDATNQIASAVAQEMVNAVTQTAMKYTGQSSFGQQASQMNASYTQQAISIADQMRGSILGSQLPSRSLMPIQGAYRRK